MRTNHGSAVREGVQMKKTFLNGHCPYRSYPPPSPRGNGQRGPFFGRQKRHLSAYYGIKFQLKMMMKMVMIMVIILMLDDDNAQKSSTTMTLWEKKREKERKGERKDVQGQLLSICIQVSLWGRPASCASLTNALQWHFLMANGKNWPKTDL